MNPWSVSFSSHPGLEYLVDYLPNHNIDWDNLVQVFTNHPDYKRLPGYTFDIYIGKMGELIVEQAARALNELGYGVVFPSGTKRIITGDPEEPIITIRNSQYGNRIHAQAHMSIPTDEHGKSHVEADLHCLIDGFPVVGEVKLQNSISNTAYAYDLGRRFNTVRPYVAAGIDVGHVAVVFSDSFEQIFDQEFKDLHRYDEWYQNVRSKFDQYERAGGFIAFFPLQRDAFHDVLRFNIAKYQLNLIGEPFV